MINYHLLVDNTLR